MSQAPESSPEPQPSNVSRVQAEFLRDVQAHGIVHMVTFVSEWYARIAEAAVEDHLRTALGEHADDREAAALTAQEVLLSCCRRLEYRSTDVGDELLKSAMAAAWSAKMAELTRPDLRDRWDAIRARLKGPDAAA